MPKLRLDIGQLTSDFHLDLCRRIVLLVKRLVKSVIDGVDRVYVFLHFKHVIAHLFHLGGILGLFPSLDDIYIL